MLSYINTGIWVMKRTLPLSIAIWLVFLLVLQVTHRRDFRQVRQLPGWKMLWEFLLIAYSVTILHITGVLGSDLSFQPDHILPGLLGLARVPFVGASIRMITLNVLLFVPYGFLLPLAAPSGKWNWQRALLVGLCSSLLIETAQLVTGRYSELDDVLANGLGTLAGFLLCQACFQFFQEKRRGRAVLQAGGTILCVTALLFGLSFVANGDELGAQMEAMYPGMGNKEEELEDISAVLLHSEQGTQDVTDADWDYWYRCVGTSIGNGMGHYVPTEETATTEQICQEGSGLYLEFFYDAPQVFRFENNPELPLEDVEHLLYHLDDGTVWYGSGSGELTHCITYENEEYPFQRDEEMYQELTALLEEPVKAG